MAKILVADDESDLEMLLRQKFRKEIRENRLEFFFAQNGREAVRYLEQSPDIDMVLSDINMPEMDGLTLLLKLGEMNPLVKTVIVSAYSDISNIRTAMNRGAFDFLFKPIDFDDLAITLYKTLDHAKQLRSTLRAIRENNILKMYVDENVLNFMSRSGFEATLAANETIEATVVFIDICGFTSISEQEAPDVVVRMLNQYFDVMVEEIIAEEGLIDKFMGDSVMGIFKNENQLERAVRASLSIRNKIKAIRDPLEGRPDYVPQVSIGINHGEMISGNIGSVALKRLDYTVIGDAVNLAQRLQSAAKPGQILVNRASYESIRKTFKCNPVGEVHFKNKALPEAVYEVLG